MLKVSLLGFYFFFAKTDIITGMLFNNLYSEVDDKSSNIIQVEDNSNIALLLLHYQHYYATIFVEQVSLFLLF